MKIENKWLFAFDLLMIVFVIIRLLLEYVFHPFAQWLFGNGPNPYTEKIAGQMVISYWLFPDFFKTKIFLFLVVWPYFLVRFIPWLKARNVKPN